jgi:hypothetical protein
LLVKHDGTRQIAFAFAYVADPKVLQRANIGFSVVALVNVCHDAEGTQERSTAGSNAFALFRMGLRGHSGVGAPGLERDEGTQAPQDHPQDHATMAGEPVFVLKPQVDFSFQNDGRREPDLTRT